jgi:hypothetical protein
MNKKMNSVGDMEGYDADFDPPLEKRLECPICLLAQRDPMQTPCGHRFCGPCLHRAIHVTGPKCPVDNQRIRVTQVRHILRCKWFSLIPLLSVNVTGIEIRIRKQPLLSELLFQPITGRLRQILRSVSANKRSKQSHVIITTSVTAHIPAN